MDAGLDAIRAPSLRRLFGGVLHEIAAVAVASGIADQGTEQVR
jgi:hypothetical protein